MFNIFGNNTDKQLDSLETLVQRANEFTYNNFAQRQPRSENFYKYAAKYAKWRTDVKRFIDAQNTDDPDVRALFTQAEQLQDIKQTTITPVDFNEAKSLYIKALNLAKGNSVPNTTPTLISAVPPEQNQDIYLNQIKALVTQAEKFNYQNFAVLQPRSQRHYKYAQEYAVWKQQVEEAILGKFKAMQEPYDALQNGLSLQNIKKEIVTEVNFNQAKQYMLKALQLAMEADKLPSEKIVVSEPIAIIFDKHTHLVVQIEEEIDELVATPTALLNIEEIFAFGIAGVEDKITSYAGVIICIQNEEIYPPRTEVSTNHTFLISACLHKYDSKMILVWDNSIKLPDALKYFKRIDYAERELKPEQLLELIRFIRVNFLAS